jgi:TPP-dependent pyruvate/acetoin dehydrogenase alpha subunit
MAAKSNRAVAEPELEAPRHPTDLLLGLYRTLVKCRMADEKARTLFRQGKVAGNFFSGVGQEGTEVGAAYSLREDDWVAPSHRDWTANIIKGVPLKFCFAQIMGKVTSPDRGRSAPAHMGYPPLNVITPASTIAAHLNVGAGIALGLRMQGKDAVVMAFFGDGATSIGPFHEALNFAAVHKLALVAVCQNNLWAESVPLRLQAPVKDLADRAKAYGFPGVTVDGNDVLAVYDAAVKAIARARASQGPTLIECKTYRWYGHSEIDPAKYRLKEEVDAWKKKDPVPRFEKFLTEKKVLTEAQKKQVAQEINREIDEAVAFAEKSPLPEPAEAAEFVWA